MAAGLERGLDVLLALDGGEELGVTRIAELVGREKSQVSRTLKSLAELGFVERDAESLAYRLGWRVFALAAGARDERLLGVAPARLRALVATLGEGAHLSVLRGDGVLTLLSETPSHAVQAVDWVGRVVPAGCTSAGYALLLDHERDEVAPYLPDAASRRAHPRGPQNATDLWQRLQSARRRGYALVDEELEPGLSAVAAPVRDFSGRIVAAVNVSGPKFRFGMHLRRAGDEIRAAAEDLSHELGWT